MMRLLLLSLLYIIPCVNTSSIREVKLEVFSNTDNQFDSIFRTVRLINADNKHASIVSKVSNCIENPTPTFCSEVNDREIIIALTHKDLVEKYALTSEEGAEQVKLVERAFKLFFNKVLNSFEEKSEDLDNSTLLEDLWKLFWTSSLQERYTKALLSTEIEKNKFLDENKHEKVFFVLMIQPDLFTSLSYVVFCLQMSLSTNFKIGVINCAETPQLCSWKKSDSALTIEEFEAPELDSIPLYPVLVAYKDLKKYKVYDGELDYSSVYDWAKRLGNPVLSVLTTDIVPMYRSGIVPGFEQVQDTVTMLFISTRKHEVYENYLNFALRNHGKYHLTVMIEEEISKWPNQPAFITMKPLEQVSKAFVKFQDLTSETIADYISTSIYPSIHDLNSAQSILTALSIRSPLTIFVDTTKRENQNAFAKLASEHPIRQNTSEFAVIIGRNILGSYFLESLGVSLAKPSYVLLNKQRTCLYTKAIASESRDEILHWINTSLTEPCERDIQFDLERFVKLSQWDRYEKVKELLNNEQLKRNHDEF